MKPDEVPHPDHIKDDFDWDSLQGEHLDASSRRSLRNYWLIVSNFSDFFMETPGYVHGRELWTSFNARLASIAHSRLLKRGLSTARSVEETTIHHLSRAKKFSGRQQGFERLLRKLKERHKQKGEE